VDIVVSSLMAHHLEDEEIVALLRWMEATAQVGWFITIWSGRSGLVECFRCGEDRAMAPVRTA